MDSYQIKGILCEIGEIFALFYETVYLDCSFHTFPCFLEANSAQLLSESL